MEINEMENRDQELAFKGVLVAIREFLENNETDRAIEYIKKVLKMEA